jgi:hypothetical protein
MNVEVFTICDAATTTAGKLNILGSFDTISAEQFPVTHAECVVACRLRTEDADPPTMQLEMRIIDPDGRDVIPPVIGEISGQPGLQHHLWRLHGFLLPRPGTFYVDLMVNGSLLNRLPLYVRQSAPGFRD